MYEARQNKEKVSRRIDGDGSGARHGVKKKNLNESYIMNHIYRMPFSIQRIILYSNKEGQMFDIRVFSNKRIEDFMYKNVFDYLQLNNIYRWKWSDADIEKYARSSLEAIVDYYNTLDAYKHFNGFVIDNTKYKRDLADVIFMIRSIIQFSIFTPNEKNESVRFLEQICGNGRRVSGQGGIFIGNPNKWHLHIDIGTQSHLKYGNDNNRFPLNNDNDLINAANAILNLSDNDAVKCYSWMRKEYILLTNKDLPIRIEKNNSNTKTMAISGCNL